MLPIFGSALVIVCVLGGFSAIGGNLAVLWQPFELLIIIGASLGAYIVANPSHVLEGHLAGGRVAGPQAAL